MRLTKEQLEQRIAIFIYESYIRSELEDYHCHNLEADYSLYMRVIHAVQRTIRNINRTDEVGPVFSSHLTDHFSSIYESYNIPKDLGDVNDISPSSFVVSGELKKAYKNHIKLGSQKVIKEINIDMIDRVYTLIKRGIIRLIINVEEEQ